MRSAATLSGSPQLCMAQTLAETPPASATIESTTGRIASRTMGCISLGGPGKQKTIACPIRALNPGAVPFEFAMHLAPTGQSACFAFMGGICRPRSSNRFRKDSRASASSTNATPPSASAKASRVRSSSVGPSPPVITTIAASVTSCKIAAEMAARSSLTVRCSITKNPRRRNSCAIQPAFRSEI